MKVHNISSGYSPIAQAIGLMYGHHSFVMRNTGTTIDAHIQHYIQNEDGVLSNNRHFIADTMAQYQPNGDGTTEGQALHIIGYCHFYLATGNVEFLNAAIHAWDAYIKYYYRGQSIPETAQRYICNWLVNSKEPVLANYPINPEVPTCGGFKCVPLLFTNGKAQIPHGAPYWGEYLDSATYAHRGFMTWEAINASVQKIQENIDGEIDWLDLFSNFRTGSPSRPYDSLAWIDWAGYFQNKAGGEHIGAKETDADTLRAANYKKLFSKMGLNLDTTINYATDQTYGKPMFIFDVVGFDPATSGGSNFQQAALLVGTNGGSPTGTGMTQSDLEACPFLMKFVNTMFTKISDYVGTIKSFLIEMEVTDVGGGNKKIVYGTFAASFADSKYYPGHSGAAPECRVSIKDVNVAKAAKVVDGEMVSSGTSTPSVTTLYADGSTAGYVYITIKSIYQITDMTLGAISDYTDTAAVAASANKYSLSTIPVITGYLLPSASRLSGKYADMNYIFDSSVDVSKIKTSPTAVWGGSDSKEKEYNVSWVNVWTGNKIGIGKGPDDQLWSGDIIEENIPASDYGMVKLEDETINGVYFFNYATKNPVADGGYMFARNEPWHNRPVHTPFLGSVNQLGNAADAEVWFIDACYLLYRITGEDKYKKALNSVFFTANEYTDIDATDKYFRQSTNANTPFTDGISYDFSYPADTVIEYGRDASGYITISADKSSQHFIEQQSVWFRVDANSKLRVTSGGVGITGEQMTCKAMLDISTTKTETDNPTWYGISLPKSTEITPTVHDVPISSLALMTNPNNNEDYLVADSRAVTDYGGCTWKEDFENNIYDGRSATIIKTTFPTDSGGFIIGFWLTSSTKATPQSIVYRADKDFNMRIEDDNNWRWWWMLPATNGKWARVLFTPETAKLSGWQPDHDDTETKPTAPVYGDMAQILILLDGDDTDAHFDYYVVNDVPPLFSENNGWTMTYRMMLSCTESWNALVGDCTIIDYRRDSLAYCPGVIPFSNIYSEGTDQIGAWHGMPYPGYQYPFMYTIHNSDKYDLWLNNQIEFLYDSQQAYYKQIGIMGPGCAAYIWNRWDNYKYGKADTWTTFHWGDGRPWAGYQCRAFNAAARTWYEMKVRGKTVPAKLKTYVENWLTWLAAFAKTNGGTPSKFPVAPGIPTYDPDDFTGHMCGLWLAGACYAKMAGSEADPHDTLINTCIKELAQNFTVTDIPGKAINGAWSSAPRASGDNGMAFGFYTGEIFRGLSLYVMLKRYGPDFDFYQLMKIKDHALASID